MNQELVYILYIHRKDIQPLLVLETSEFDKIKETWRTLTDNWRKSVEEKRPFELEQPIITSFDPGLITEIRIYSKSIATETHGSNPYVKDMITSGFSDTFTKNTSVNSELLDKGFK